MRTLSCGLLLALLVVGIAAAAESPLHAGVAVVDITPPIGYRLSGYFHERASTGVHDPLKARAIVFKQGETQAALVFCDLIGIAPEVAAEARPIAEAKTGIPTDHIVIAATHSHTGPLYFGTMREHYHALALATTGADAHEEVDYAAVLTEKLVNVIAAAQASLAPVTLEATRAEQLGLSFNRRFHMKGGGPVRFNPGKMNPNILRVAGPIDPEVSFLLARAPETGAARFSLSVFALHLDTVGGTEFAADYPYYLAGSLRETLGDDLVSIFGVGTCGDINHVDVSHKRAQKGHGEAERIGATLGKTLVKALESLQPLKAPSLAVRSRTVAVPLKSFTPDEAIQARALLIKAEKESVPFLDRVHASQILKLEARKTTVLPMEVQAFRLNQDVALVALPGEIFAELGMAIKKASPFPKTFVVELANDAPAYIPTKKAMAEGSYETVNCLIQPGGGELLVEAAIGLLAELGA